MFSTSEASTLTPNSFYPPQTAEGPVERIVADERLKAELSLRMPDAMLGDAGETPTSYNNAEVAVRIRPDYTERQLDKFERKLDREGTFDVPITWREMEVEGVLQKVPLVAATELGANHGDMVSMIYLRDQIQVARSYMELALHDPERYREKGDMGRRLLQSSLHLMSTPDQLKRADNVITKLGSKAGQADYPFISFPLGDLETKKPNNWRNNQDSFQMLADFTFDALNQGFIQPEDLMESHKKFLGSVLPLLESVGFPVHGSSGTWEEFVAKPRTSVLSVEASMLCKMKETLMKFSLERVGFLETGYRQYGGQDSLTDTVETMAVAGLTQIGKQWPYESPQYDRRDTKYREADAALAYGLMYDIPHLLEKYQVPIACADGRTLSAIALENLLLEQLDGLIDPETGAMKRYVDDSYLRLNFLTHEVQANVAAVKARIAGVALRSGREPDLEAKQRLRHGVVPKGREATWPHPVAQLSAWAARRQMQAQKQMQPHMVDRYRALSIKYLNQSARSITGADQYHIVRQENGSYGVQQVKAFRVPEAMVAYREKDGTSKKTDMIVPSPHTQLNWAAATQGEAFAMCRLATHAANAYRLGGISIKEDVVAAAA